MTLNPKPLLEDTVKRAYEQEHHVSGASTTGTLGGRCEFS